MKELAFCLIVLFSAGCAPDPLGITGRTQIRASAAIQIEQAKTDAARAQAQALVDAEIARQAGLNRRYATVAFIAPFVVLAIGLVLVGLLIINWRGRIAFEQMKAMAVPSTAKLPSTLISRLAKNGYEPQVIDGVWWPVDVRTGKMFSTPIPKRLLEVVE